MSYQIYIYSFLAAALLSYILTLIVIQIATKYKIFDMPDPRKVHTKPTPRLGGLAIALTFIIIVKVFLMFRPDLVQFSPWIWFNYIDKHLLGTLIGGVILIIVGAIDDVKGLSPATKLFWQIVAACIVVGFGIGVDVIRNPFGGPLINLDKYVVLLNIFHHTYQFMVLGDLLVIIWIVLMINVINFLDGLDGLAAGVSLIAVVTLFILSLLPSINQAQTALLCIILAGAISGFLPLNFFPAKIFMGDSGSMFLGYMLAVLAVISGGKVATSLLVLGFPILDGVWVIGRRLIHKKSPFIADKKHLHHRLLSIGLSQRQSVIAIYIITALFGTVALLAKTQAKFWAIIGLILIMIILAVTLVVIELKKEKKNAS
jgi:UDP-GlcNAc:undecaprenyl-phosphate GlcNAc-1-phosphate transferase